LAINSIGTSTTFTAALSESGAAKSARISAVLFKRVPEATVGSISRVKVACPEAPADKSPTNHSTQPLFNWPRLRLPSSERKARIQRDQLTGDVIRSGNE